MQQSKSQSILSETYFTLEALANLTWQGIVFVGSGLFALVFLILSYTADRMRVWQEDRDYLDHQAHKRDRLNPHSRLKKEKQYKFLQMRRHYLLKSRDAVINELGIATAQKAWSLASAKKTHLNKIYVKLEETEFKLHDLEKDLAYFA
jgi:hypothetical protein